MKKFETIFRYILISRHFVYFIIIEFVTLEIQNYKFYNEVKICLLTQHNIYRQKSGF